MCKLWKAFEIVAEHAMKVGAQVFNEWPKGCTYWSNRRVAAFFKRHKFEFTIVHGCMYNLVSQFGKNAGIPIKKPWKIARSPNSAPLKLELCDGEHDHIPCSGKETKGTENYTKELVADIYIHR